MTLWISAGLMTASWPGVRMQSRKRISIAPVNEMKNSSSRAIIQMNAMTKAAKRGGEVAAFPAGWLRHFQKQGSVKEGPKTRRSPVQVELKSSDT